MIHISKSRADGSKTTVGAAEAVCGVHITIQHPITTPAAVSNKTGGNAHVAAVRTQCVKGVCSAYDLPEDDDEPERPYISFTATNVQRKTEAATAPRQKNDTWPFGLLTAARPWLFMDDEKLAISFRVKDEPDLSYMNGGVMAKDNYCTARP